MIHHSYTHTLDPIKNNLLRALYRQDSEKVIHNLHTLIGMIQKKRRLQECHLKTLHQVYCAVNKLTRPPHPPLSPKVTALNRALKKHVVQITRKQTKQITYIDYETYREQLGLDDLSFSTLLATVSTFQLTTGCSQYCRRCNEWALPGVRRQFTFTAIQRLLKELFANNNQEFTLYGASDPLDWQEGTKTISDIIEFLSQHQLSPVYGLLTKIPRGKFHLASQLIKSGADIGVSVTHKNRKRAAALEKITHSTIQTHHNTDDLLISAGRDEDFCTIKPSITDCYGTELTPDGAYEIIPTFTSALNPTGQYRYPVSQDTPWFLLRKTGRHALPVEYYKPLKGIDRQGTVFSFKQLLKPQIENILLDNGTYALTPPGMTSLLEFFQTFDAPAVHQRQNMLPTMRKTLLRDAGSTVQGDFRIASYKAMCDPEIAKSLRIKAISFFLSDIIDYLQDAPDERAIITYLRQQDPILGPLSDPHLIKRFEEDIPQLFMGEAPEVFKMFQALVAALLNNSAQTAVINFVRQHPAGYDEISDQFTGID